jgi:hypothetical protein
MASIKANFKAKNMMKLNFNANFITILILDSNLNKQAEKSSSDGPSKQLKKL